MPPLRNAPMPLKPAKTERTHEENQERAYIAASRRSDRSLEARIESARRASEIHKRRTGRSLRVREEDVVNEEMYEEEDDDLPQQYRRLTAHLATSNSEFDRRLRAYITNQVAMRSVFGQAAGAAGLTDAPFPSSSHFFNTALMQQMGQPMPFDTPSSNNATLSNASNTMPSPTTFSQPSPSYRQTPYPTPGSGMPQGQGFNHQRSQSIATPQQPSGFHGPNSAQQSSPGATIERRMSLPVGSDLHAPSAFHQPPSPAMTSTHSGSPNQQRSAPFAASRPSIEPLTTALPLESQQLLAGGSFFDYNDPFGAALAQDAYFDPKQQQSVEQPNHQPMYSYNPNIGRKRPNAPTSISMPYTQQPHHFGNGLEQTLWGGASSGGGTQGIDPTVFDDSTSSANASGGFDSSLAFDLAGSAFSSAPVTPAIGKEEWESFLQGDAFDEQGIA